MPSDSFERRVTLSSDVGRCWQTLTDVARLVEWISILGAAQEHEPLAKYSAVLTDRIGPFSLRADLVIEVTSVEPGRFISLTGEGRDRQVDSRIFVEGKLVLEPSSDGTILHVEGRYEVTGRVATFGGPMIRSKAEAIIEEFLDGVTQTLG